MSPARLRGHTLIELIVVLWLLLAIATLGVPRLLELTGSARLDLAAQEVVAVLHRARGRALREAIQVGVKFFPVGPTVRYAVYRDGDGDGVRSKDIESGVDPPATPLLSLHRLGADVRLGFPPGAPPRDPGDPHRRLDRLRDPIRLNRSDIASFGPLGESTPGSLYLTDGERLAVVRIFGRTGRIRILRYDRATETWR